MLLRHMGLKAAHSLQPLQLAPATAAGTRKAPRLPHPLLTAATREQTQSGEGTQGVEVAVSQFPPFVSSQEQSLL